MKKYGFFIVALLLVSACQKDDVGCLLIRIENMSDFKFKNLLVNTGGGEKEYGKLASGKKSVYKAYESAYEYAYVEFEAKGEKRVIQPYDYVGETPLGHGKYTYQVYVSEFGDVSMTFEED